MTGNNDTFFVVDDCERCNKSLKGEGRIMSWFNDDTICMGCKAIEEGLLNLIVTQGKQKSSFEGIGHIPTEEEIKA